MLQHVTAENGTDTVVAQTLEDLIHTLGTVWISFGQKIAVSLVPGSKTDASCLGTDPGPYTLGSMHHSTAILTCFDRKNRTFLYLPLALFGKAETCFF